MPFGAVDYCMLSTDYQSFLTQNFYSMNNSFILFLLFLTPFSLAAQSFILSPSLISNGGELLESNSYLINFSIGEPVTQTIIGNNYILTQGFQQPDPLTISSVENLKRFSSEIKIYPNPTSDRIIVEAEFPNPRDIQFQVFNVTGQKVFDFISQLGLEGVPIDFSELKSGEYFLKLKSMDNSEEQTFKIIKS